MYKHTYNALWPFMCIYTYIYTHAYIYIENYIYSVCICMYRIVKMHLKQKMKRQENSAERIWKAIHSHNHLAKLQTGYRTRDRVQTSCQSKFCLCRLWDSFPQLVKDFWGVKGFPPLQTDRFMGVTSVMFWSIAIGSHVPRPHSLAPFWPGHRGKIFKGRGKTYPD